MPVEERNASMQNSKGNRPEIRKWSNGIIYAAESLEHMIEHCKIN